MKVYLDIPCSYLFTPSTSTHHHHPWEFNIFINSLYIVGIPVLCESSCFECVVLLYSTPIRQNVYTPSPSHISEGFASALPFFKV